MAEVRAPRRQSKSQARAIARAELAKSTARENDPNWWPDHVRQIFVAIGRAVGDAKLHPSQLRGLPEAFDTILPGHQVSVWHVPAKQTGERAGHYVIHVDGPIYAGEWRLASGRLERLAKASLRTSQEEEGFAQRQP